MATPLKFYLGEESHFITENYENRKASIFADQYKKALHVIDALVKSAKEEKNPSLQESRNNIIAFTGDRGTGKTSCMMSVVNMMEEHMAESKEKKRFATVEVVDPSFFDENTNIIYLVVGKMFAAFRTAIEKDREKGETQKWQVNELMDGFSKVLSQISLMGKSPLSENDTDIHQLNNLLVTVDLKKSLKLLVDRYLTYFEKDFLVIPVDDIDNNTDEAYQMMEQIRKYLILPNVIILISFKIEQITNVAELYFTKLYNPLLSKSKSPSISVEDMAQKYLLKLFPLEHRVALPNLATMMDKELEVYTTRDATVPLLKGSTMKYTLTALIFKKTRYLFYHATGATNQIVPSNLREYRNLLTLLCNMEDYRESKEEYNKQQFRDYFYGEWIEKHLNAEGRYIATKLVENVEAGGFNKLVVRLLSDYKPLTDIRVQEFQELLSEEETEEMFDKRNRRYYDSRSTNAQYEYTRILDAGNVEYNVSMGDVMALLNEWKKFMVSEEDKALLFFVESLYSIKLYHYYDEVTEKEAADESTNAAIDNTIKRLDDLEGVSNYEKLVGGAFFNPNLLRLLPAENRTNLLRSYRVVDIRPLRIIIGRCLAGEDVVDLEFQMVEFFALTLSRRLEGKAKGSIAPFYRLVSEVYYRTDLQKSQKAVFDLGSFFVSITNIEYAYCRIHPDLFRLATERDSSLLNKMKQLTIEKYELGAEYDNTRFLSWCAIRNAVILQELGNSFSYVRTGRTQSSDQVELLRDFFVQVSSFFIKTYDKTDADDAYAISFDYAKVFVDMFTRIKDNAYMQEVFSSVFDNGNENEGEGTQFVVTKIANGLQNRVRKDTLKTRILERSSVNEGMQDFWEAFDEMVTEPVIMRPRAEEVLRMLKARFDL